MELVDSVCRLQRAVWQPPPAPVDLRAPPRPPARRRPASAAPQPGATGWHHARRPRLPKLPHPRHRFHRPLLCLVSCYQPYHDSDVDSPRPSFSPTGRTVTATAALASTSSSSSSSTSVATGGEPDAAPRRVQEERAQNEREQVAQRQQQRQQPIPHIIVVTSSGGDLAPATRSLQPRCCS